MMSLLIELSYYFKIFLLLKITLSLTVSQLQYYIIYNITVDEIINIINNITIEKLSTSLYFVKLAISLLIIYVTVTKSQIVDHILIIII